MSKKTVQNQVSLAVKQLKIKPGVHHLDGLIVSAETMAELIKKL